MTAEQLSALGGRLRRLRRGREYTQAELADHLELSVNYYGRLERGQQQVSLKSLLRLADLYSVTLDYLVFGENSTCIS